MNYLVFDCVLNKTFITLVKNDEFINKIIESDSENYHSVYLISEIKNILEKNSLSLKDLDFIGVDVGPASFTGIRVGLCVAKIIASEANLPCVCSPSVEILSKINGKNEAVFLDARRGSFIFYNVDGEPCLIKKEEAIEVAKSLEIGIVTDTSVSKYLKENGISTTNYEEGMPEIGKILAEISYKKFNSNSKEAFNAQNIKPLYIQTPPVFSKN